MNETAKQNYIVASGCSRRGWGMVMRGAAQPFGRTLPERSSVARSVVSALVAVGAVATASILGQIATYPNLLTWFAGLTKPSFTLTGALRLSLYAPDQP